MKVLHLIDSGGLYGAEQMLLDLVQQQMQSGVESVILSSTNNPDGTKPLVVAARERGLSIKEWSMADGLNLIQARKIINYAVESGFNVLHSHGYKFNILLGLFPRWLRRLPLVCTVHGYLAASPGTKLWLYQQLDRRILASAEATVFVSRAMLDKPEFRRLKIRCPRVIYNGLNFKRTSSDSISLHPADQCLDYFKHLPDGDPNKRTILAIGRLTEEKGFADLICAFHSVVQTHPDARLVIAGEGPQRKNLERQITDLGLDGLVVLPGYINPVSGLLASADVLVMSSHTEGMPITLLEAVSANAVIVATSVGGIPEVLESYPKSILVSARQVEELTKGIVRALSDRQYLVAVDVGDFRMRFSSQSMERAYFQLYRELV